MSPGAINMVVIIVAVIVLKVTVQIGIKVYKKLRNSKHKKKKICDNE
jgi:alpha-N-acetylglucosamine transferase